MLLGLKGEFLLFQAGCFAVRRLLSSCFAVVLLVGLFSVPNVGFAGTTDASGDWFGVDADPRPVVMAARDGAGVVSSRVAAFDADVAVDAVVSPDSWGLADPAARVVVPKVGDLTLTLLDGDQVEVEVSEVALNVNSVTMVPTVGVLGHTVVDGVRDSAAVFTFTPGADGGFLFEGSINSVDGYAIGFHQLPSGDVKVEALDLSLVEQVSFVDDTEVVSTTAPGASPSRGTGTFRDGKWEVDLLVGYPTTMLSDGALTHSQIESFVNAQVELTNTTFNDSDIDLRIRLIKVTPVDYVQDISELQVDLNALKSGTGGLHKLHEQREALGADLVHLLVAEAPGACGVASLPSDPQGEPDTALWSVSARKASCVAQYTFTHELGHNLGAGHNQKDHPHPGRTFEFSYGHWELKKARSVMAYQCPSVDGVACRRLPQFSNPLVDFVGFRGVPSGVFGSVEDGVVEANNARAVGLMGPVVSAYRDPASRWVGDSRLESAVEVSRHSFPDPTEVDSVVATGAGFADALSAAPLAVRLGGPLLLTSPGVLEGVVGREVERLAPTRVVVVGSVNAVSEVVVAALRDLVGPAGVVDRVGGYDRYETSMAIVSYGWTTKGTDSVFFASGSSFPDALSANAAAGLHQGPLVLVKSTQTSVPVGLKNHLRSVGVQRAYLSGGTKAVTSEVASDLAGSFLVERFSGADRYETSAKIAARNHTPRGGIYLAWGGDYPDAMAGAASAGRVGAPVLLSKSACIPVVIDQVIQTIRPSRRILLGDISVLSEAVEDGRVC